MSSRAPSSLFESLVARSIRSCPGLLARETGRDSRLPDVEVTAGERSAFVEVKMWRAQFGSPRFFFDGSDWSSASAQKSSLADFLIFLLNHGPDARSFLNALTRHLGRDRIVLHGSKSGQKKKSEFPDWVSRGEMLSFLSTRQNRYIFLGTDCDLSHVVAGHYLEGKKEPASYLQYGNSFYRFGSGDPLGILHPEVPVFDARGRLGVRVSVRSSMYELVPEVKPLVCVPSPFSLIDDDKRFPFLFPH